MIRTCLRDNLFSRVTSIIEQARPSVVRTVNTEMVQAYWLIGREIVEEEQAGEARAEYGERLVAELSKRLTARYGRGFSITNLKYFRQFSLIYRGDTPEIGHAVSDQFSPDLSWTHYLGSRR